MVQPPYQPEVKAATIEAARNLGFEFVDSNGPFQHGTCIFIDSPLNSNYLNAEIYFLIDNNFVRKNQEQF